MRRTPPKVNLPVIRNYRKVSFEDEGGNLRSRREAIQLPAIVETIRSAFDGWPRRYGGGLFVPSDAKPIDAIPTASDVTMLTTHREFEAWLKQRASVVFTRHEVFLSGEKCVPVSMTTVFDALRMSGAEPVIAIEWLPHYPPISGVHYVSEFTDGDGSTLEEFAGLFTPETELDRQLLIAALLTPGWGSTKSPAFVITSSHGVGSGKTTAAELITDVWGGAVALNATDPDNRIEGRLLSPNALAKRCVLVDNVRDRIARAAVERLITADSVNGHRLYTGDAERPNTLTWFFTANSPDLSRDLASRSVVIRLGRPIYGSGFATKARVFVTHRRVALLRDCYQRLRGPAAATIEPQNRGRFAAWEDGVLTRLPAANALAELIRARSEAADQDEAEASDLAESFRVAIRARGWCPATDRVIFAQESFVAIVRSTFDDARIRSAKQARSRVRGLLGRGELTCVLPNHPSKTHPRGPYWIGPESDENAAPRVLSDEF